jgi:hypothetical protein
MIPSAMAELLKLSAGHYSLEFDPAELPVVASAIKELYGIPDVEDFGMAINYTFGGQSFTFQNDLDDPCLISSSTDGDRILEALLARLSGFPRS